MNARGSAHGPVRLALAGDWHGNIDWAEACLRSLPDDIHTLIQLGDFGLMGDGMFDYIEAVDRLASARGIDVLVIPGNHEDFDFLDRQPVDGAGRLRLAGNVATLPRGYRFDVAGVRLAAVGGGVSVDRRSRTAGQSWWPQEEITDAQEAAIAGIGPVDVLLTHDAPWSADPPRLPETELIAWAGPEVVEAAHAHHRRLQRILEALEPRLLVHAHFHHRYGRDISWLRPDGASRSCRVEGLGCDDMAGNLAVLTCADGTFEFADLDDPIHRRRGWVW